MIVGEPNRSHQPLGAVDRALLLAGALLGPLFYAVVVAEMATRPGYSIRVHPLSLLELGPGGWVQSLNFAVCGLLALLFAVGLLRRGEPRRIGSLFLLSGLGLLVVAKFPPDPYLGFPPGAPMTGGGPLSAHARLHGLGFMLTFLPLIIAPLAVGWRARAGQPRLATLSFLAGGLIPLVLAAGFAVQRWNSLAFFAVGILAFGWMALFALNRAAEPARGAASPGSG